MPISTREQRQAAVGLLLPFQTPAVEPDPGIDAAERAAAAWSYGGIPLAPPGKPIAHLAFLWQTRDTTLVALPHGQGVLGASRQQAPRGPARRQTADVLGGSSSHAD